MTPDDGGPAAEPTRELTGAIAAGDTAAFARFYRAWFDRLVAEARRATGRDEDFCLDVVQDTMMRVIRKLPKIDTDARLAVWLRRTVRSCAYDRLRQDMRRRAREERRAEREQQDAGAEQALAVETSARLAWLERELTGVGEPAATMLLMRHRFGWTLERIGSAFGLGAGAVDGRIRRAVETLQRRAHDADEGGAR